MRKSIISLWLTSILTFPCDSLQIIQIKDHETTEVEISSSEHTRISVENDRIAQLFGIDGRLSFEVDELNGQVFITPSPDLKGSSILITVTTEKGLTHDLRIKPSKIEANSILLRPKSQHIQDHRFSEALSYETMIVNFVKAYGRLKEQDDIQLVTLEGSIIDKISSEIELTISTELHSPQFIGKICVVENIGDNPLMISPHHFAKFQPISIAFHQRDLKPLEKTTVLLIIRKVTS